MKAEAFLAAYARGVNCQRVGAVDELFSQAAILVTPPAVHDVMDALPGLLDNLVPAATKDKTMVEQLTTANLSLTTLVVALMATNKKLTNTVAPYNLTPHGHSSSGGCNGDGTQWQQDCPKAVWGNYCWTHGYKVQAMVEALQNAPPPMSSSELDAMEVL
jgi:hypothetical protein